MAVKVKRIVTHGKFKDTLLMVGRTIECPECWHKRTYGSSRKDHYKPFKVSKHTEGILYVVDCPHCNCCFHIDIK